MRRSRLRSATTIDDTNDRNDDPADDWVNNVKNSWLHEVRSL